MLLCSLRWLLTGLGSLLTVRHMGLSIVLLKTRQLASLRVSDPRESRARKCPRQKPAFYNLILTVPSRHFCCMLLVIQTSPGAVWEGTPRGCEYQETGIIRGHLGGWIPQTLSSLVNPPFQGSWSSGLSVPTMCHGACVWRSLPGQLCSPSASPSISQRSLCSQHCCNFTLGAYLMSLFLCLPPGP